MEFKMQERTILIIVGVVLVLAAFSPLIFMKNDNEYNYNDFKIQKIPTGWATWAYKGSQPYYLQLRHDPKTLENISIDSDIRSLILSKNVLGITIDPNLTSLSVIGAIDIANILGRRLGLYNIQVIGGTTEFANDATQVFNCSDVAQDVNIILLKLGGKTEVYLEDGCIIVEGETQEDITRSADRLVYQILDVMK